MTIDEMREMIDEDDNPEAVKLLILVEICDRLERIANLAQCGNVRMAGQDILTREE